MHDLQWQFFENAIQRRGDAWVRKTQSGIVAPDSFALVLCYGNMNASTEIAEILSYELPTINGYSRQSVLFEPYDSHLKTWVSENIVFTATQDFTFNNLVVLSNIPLGANGITVTGIDTATEVLTSVAHGLSDNDPIMFEGSLPYPLQNSLIYYTQLVDADTFKVRFSPNGPAIDIVDPFSSSFTVKPYLSANPPHPEFYANLQTSTTLKAGESCVIRVQFPIA